MGCVLHPRAAQFPPHPGQGGAGAAAGHHAPLRHLQAETGRGTQGRRGARLNALPPINTTTETERGMERDGGIRKDTDEYTVYIYKEREREKKKVIRCWKRRHFTDTHCYPNWWISVWVCISWSRSFYRGLHWWMHDGEKSRRGDSLRASQSLGTLMHHGNLKKSPRRRGMLSQNSPVVPYSVFSLPLISLAFLCQSFSLSLVFYFILFFFQLPLKTCEWENKNEILSFFSLFNSRMLSDCTYFCSLF